MTRAVCLLCLGLGCSTAGPEKDPADGVGTAGAAPSAATSTGGAPATASAGTGGPVGTAGSGGAPAVDPGTAGPMMPDDKQPDPGSMTLGPIDWHGDIRGRCEGLNSGFPSDEACIPAPPEAEGMQIHIGPSDYTDQAQLDKFIMEPGGESSECWTYVTPNDKKIFYQTSTFSGRAGTHHMIHNKYDGPLPPTTGFEPQCGGDGSANQDGLLPGASKAYMPRGVVAPEYEHVGRVLEAHTTAGADMHYFNLTEQPILREVWINLYYAKAEDITQYSESLVALGGMSWQNDDPTLVMLGIKGTPIPVGADEVYRFECPAIVGNGFIMDLLGHYHSHGRRFTASIKRKSGQVEEVFEMYNYLDPATFEYNSAVMNPPLSENAAGAVSGQLAVSEGDIVQWECHIINDGDVPLTYVNEVKNGEMCNLWGNTVGIDPLNCFVASPLADP